MSHRCTQLNCTLGTKAQHKRLVSLLTPLILPYEHGQEVQLKAGSAKGGS